MWVCYWETNFGYQSPFLKFSLEKRGHPIIRVVLYSGQYGSQWMSGSDSQRGMLFSGEREKTQQGGLQVARDSIYNNTIWRATKTCELRFLLLQHYRVWDISLLFWVTYSGPSHPALVTCWFTSAAALLLPLLADQRQNETVPSFHLCNVNRDSKAQCSHLEKAVRKGLQSRNGSIYNLVRFWFHPLSLETPNTGHAKPITVAECMLNIKCWCRYQSMNTVGFL